MQIWMNSRVVVRGLAWRTPRKSYLPQSPQTWSSNLSCQRIDFLLPIFNHQTMNKKTYQALADTDTTTVDPELVRIKIGLVVTHRDDTLAVCRQRIGPIRWSASRVRPSSQMFTHLSPRPSRRRGSSSGSGDGAHQSMLARLLPTSKCMEYAQVAWLPSLVDHMTAPRRRGCRFTLPPCWLLRRTLALAALPASSLCHNTTALRSPMTDGHPCFPYPAAAPSARAGPANSHLARSICHVGFLRLSSRRIDRNSRQSTMLSGRRPRLFTTDPPGGPPRSTLMKTNPFA
jgi:hypothetical protein